MRAAAYHASDPAKGCIGGPGASSIRSSGREEASTAKKKSGPWPTHAVPSCSSLVLKVEVIASWSAGLADLASAMSWVAFIFSAAKTQVFPKKNSAAKHNMPRLREIRLDTGMVASSRNADTNGGSGACQTFGRCSVKAK